MKFLSFIISIIILNCCDSPLQDKINNYEKLVKPELFEIGIISLGYHEHRMTISPDYNDIYFTISKPDFSTFKIMHSKFIDGKWTTPTVAPFSKSGNNIHPMYTPDGKRIYFSSNRPLDDLDNTTDLNIWYVEKIDGSNWSKPIPSSNAINSNNHEANPSIMLNGTLFYDVIEINGSKSKNIYSSILIDGHYQKGLKLPNTINTVFTELGPFIHPKGMYLLFYSDRPGTLGKRDLYSYGNSDIYVSFSLGNNNWSEPKNLGPEINSEVLDWSPTLSPDNKYLIFSSYRNTKPIIPLDVDYGNYLSKTFGNPKTGNGSFYIIKSDIINKLKQ